MSQLLKSNRDIILIVCIAFAVRVSVVGVLHYTGYTADEKEYISLATKLSEGKPFLDSNNEWSTKAPLFPFMLSLVFRLFGTGLLIPHVLGCALGAAVVLLSFRLCQQLLTDRSTALSAAWMVALHPSFIVYADVLQTETMYLVFVLLAFLFVGRTETSNSLAEPAMLGLVAAMATLTRAVFFGFFPLLLLVIAWMNRSRRIGAKILVALGVWCVMLVPWTMRNYSIHNAFVPVSSWSGISFLLGNNPYSNGTWSGKPGFADWFAAKAEENGIDIGRSTEIERSALGKKLALEFIASQPQEMMKLALVKLYMHWVYPITNSDSNTKLQALCVVADIVLYALGGLGLIAVGTKRKMAPLLAAIIFFTVLQVLMHCESRYRLPIMPFISILAAAGLSVLIDTRALREFVHVARNKYMAVLWLLFVVFVYAFTGWQFLSGKI